MISDMKLLRVLWSVGFSFLAAGCHPSGTNSDNYSARHYDSIPYLGQKEFETLFPHRNKLYDYASFLKAYNQLVQIGIPVERKSNFIYRLPRFNYTTVDSLPVRYDPAFDSSWAQLYPDTMYVIHYGDFLQDKDPAVSKRELAAFLANIAHETRSGKLKDYGQGLVKTEEKSDSLYVVNSSAYPAANGAGYFGRGPLQLSYNTNYGFASSVIFGDKAVLLNSPDLVIIDPVVAFKTAIFYWMTPILPKPSLHSVMAGEWQPSVADSAAGRVPGFGMTINIINGLMECGKGKNPAMLDRIGFYHYFLKRLGVEDSNCNCDCGGMQPY